MRTVIVQDNFVQAGGGERVAEALARCLPHADIVSTVVVDERLSPYIRSRGVKTTWLQFFPLIKVLHRHYFLFFPIAARSLDLSRYDCVVSSCYGFAKMVRKAPGAVHICYCHTPTRWIWRFNDYSRRERFNTLSRSLLRLIIHALKPLDRAAALGVDHFIANSTTVADRIRTCYGREPVILHPPVQSDRFTPSKDVGDFYLVVSRLCAYKRIDLAVIACEKLGRRLKVVGEGPSLKQLQAVSGPMTEFLGSLPDPEVAVLMAQCKALLFAGEEDFGITPLEVSASGRPTVAYGKGGALDTIISGLNGIFFLEQTPDSLISAMLLAETIVWESERICAHAELFDMHHFQVNFQAAMRTFVPRP